MVHVPFTWRHGGREVFLTGSFDGWRERIRMIPVEGSTSIVHRVIDLPSGDHQYKFLVDGIWRVDEEQLCIKDEYGIIKNVISVRELEINSARLSVEVAHSTMNFDNAQRMQVGASSSCTVLQESLKQLPANLLDVSRHRIHMHLSSSKVHELMPISGKVFTLDTEVAVKQAFHIMYEQGLVVVPLWDEQSARFSGMLTASDFILILLELHRDHPTLNYEELEMHTISAWKAAKPQYRRDVVRPMVPPFRRPLIQASPDDSLRDAALKVVNNEVSGIPVIDSKKDGSCPILLHVTCLAEVLKCLCRHLTDHPQYMPLLLQPVRNLPLGTWAREAGTANGRQLFTLRATDSISSALNLLLDVRISSVPIVDHNGALINIYSRSDITSLARNNLYTHIHPDQTPISHVLEFLNEATQPRYRTCTRNDPLHNVMELLSDPAVRRVIVIDACNQQVEGIITLRDVFTFILG